MSLSESLSLSEANSTRKSDDVITLIDDVLDILAELVREEPDDGEDDETSEDARTDIAHRHDHRVSETTTSMLQSLSWTVTSKTNC